ncbi:MAG: hypothetical protein WCA64_01085 [Gallionella sp.]
MAEEFVSLTDSFPLLAHSLASEMDTRNIMGLQPCKTFVSRLLTPDTSVRLYRSGAFIAKQPPTRHFRIFAGQLLKNIEPFSATL